MAEWIKSIHSTDISSPWRIDGHSTLICERKLESITQLALNISKALSEIHDAGVTHNNLGPENIIVDETGEKDTVLVKIIGLGSASLMTDLNKMHLKARVNILSLGSILFEIFTGRVILVCLKEKVMVQLSSHGINSSLF